MGFAGVWPFVFYDVYDGYEGTVAHELEHIKQQVREPFSFHVKYLWYNFKYGYKKNPYEIEARVAEKAFRIDKKLEENRVKRWGKDK